MDFLTHLFVYAGVINSLYFPAAIYICWARNGYFSFKEYPVSIAGHNSETARFFMLSTIVSAFLEACFLYAIFAHFPELNTPLLIALPAVGMSSLVVAGVLHGPNNRMIHRGAVFVMFGSLLAWSCIFTYAMFRINPLVGGASAGLTFISVVSALYFKYRYDMFGIAQLIFAASVIIWNLLFTYAILYP